MKKIEFKENENLKILNRCEIKKINGGGVIADFIEKVVRDIRCGCMDIDLTGANSVQYGRRW
jgi:hypothetical protein